MVHSLYNIFLILLCVLFVIYLIKGFVMLISGIWSPYYPSGNIHDDEEETVTTTTTTTVYHDEPVIENRYIGTLKKTRDSNGWVVIDPVDRERIYVEEFHDQYTDAEGRLWKLE